MKIGDVRESIVFVHGKGRKERIVPISPHTIRYYYAQDQLQNELDVYSLSRLLGHSTINITKIYLQSIQDESIIELSRKISVFSNI